MEGGDNKPEEKTPLKPKRKFPKYDELVVDNLETRFLTIPTMYTKVLPLPTPLKSSPLHQPKRKVKKTITFMVPPEGGFTQAQLYATLDPPFSFKRTNYQFALRKREQFHKYLEITGFFVKVSRIIAKMFEAPVLPTDVNFYLYDQLNVHMGQLPMKTQMDTAVMRKKDLLDKLSLLESEKLYLQLCLEDAETRLIEREAELAAAAIADAAAEAMKFAAEYDEDNEDSDADPNDPTSGQRRRGNSNPGGGGRSDSKSSSSKRGEGSLGSANSESVAQSQGVDVSRKIGAASAKSKKGKKGLK